MKLNNICILTILVYVLVFGYLGTLNAESLRYVNAFVPDEKTAIGVIHHMMKNELDPGGFFNYGSLYFYLAIIALLPFHWLGQVTDQHIIIVLRWISLFAAMSCGLLIYSLAKRMINKWAGILSAGLFLSSPVVVEWVLKAHPDILQAFLVLMTLYCLVFAWERKEKKFIYESSILAGLAIGTKYVGFFLIPVIFLVIFMWIWDEDFRIERQERIARLTRQLVFSGAIIVITFLITNPYVIVDFGNFLNDILYESAHTALGHTWIEQGGWDWFGVLFSVDLGGGVAILYFGYVIFFMVSKLRFACIRFRLKQVWSLFRKNFSELIFHLFVLIFFGYLLFRVRMANSKYLLSVVPILYIFSVGFVFQLLAFMGRIKMKYVGVFLLLVILIYTYGINLFGTFNYIESYLQRKSSLQVYVADWLRMEMSHYKKIWISAYVYLPEDFELFGNSRYLSFESIYRGNPDMLIVSSKILDRYKDESLVSQAVAPRLFEESNRVYQAMNENLLCGYTLIRRFSKGHEFILVFERVVADSRVYCTET